MESIKRVVKVDMYIVIETVNTGFLYNLYQYAQSFHTNLVVWGVDGDNSICLYYEDMDKPLRRTTECEALVFCMSVCESLGSDFTNVFCRQQI